MPKDVRDRAAFSVVSTPPPHCYAEPIECNVTPACTCFRRGQLKLLFFLLWQTLSSCLVAMSANTSLGRLEGSFKSQAPLPYAMTSPFHNTS
eukprot:1181823-Rhodomonas_salina.1